MPELKNVVIVGAGALGSHVALLLRNCARIKVVDFDRVEQKNVLSQFHVLSSVGKNKAVALQQAMKFVCGVKVDAVPTRLGRDNVREILSGADLVIDAVDNGETRGIIQEFCLGSSIPCLHGALAAGGVFGQVMWAEDFKVDYGSAGQATCEDGEHLPFISAVSANLAQAAQAFLKDGRRTGYQVSSSGSRPV